MGNRKGNLPGRGIFLFVFSILISCNSDQTSKPEAIGKSRELLIVTNQIYSDSNAVKLIYNYFGKDFPGLPQPEPWYRISQIPVNEFSGVFNRHRNIIYLLVNDTVTSEKVSFSKDVWAKNQLVVIAQATGLTALDSVISSSLQGIEFKIHEMEQRNYKLNAGKNRDEKLCQELSKKFSINLDIPRDYFLAKAADDFAWYRKETENSSSNILIYSKPYTSELDFESSSIVRERDSLAKLFIPGPAEGSFMTTDKGVPWNRMQLEIDKGYAIELRGLWKVEGDFMGGPFVHYVIHNANNNRLYCIDFFVFAPKFDKRDYIIAAEQIISSFSFFNK